MPWVTDSNLVHSCHRIKLNSFLRVSHQGAGLVGETFLRWLFPKLSYGSRFACRMMQDVPWPRESLQGSARNAFCIFSEFYPCTKRDLLWRWSPRHTRAELWRGKLVGKVNDRTGRATRAMTAAQVWWLDPLIWILHQRETCGEANAGVVRDVGLNHNLRDFRVKESGLRVVECAEQKNSTAWYLNKKQEVVHFQIGNDLIN